MRIKRLAFTLISALAAVSVSASGMLSVGKTGNGSAGYFPVKGASLICDPGDYMVVRNVAEMLGDDLQAVTGVRPEIRSGLTPDCGNAVVIGTIGHSSAIDELVKAGVIPADSIAGEWERFIIKNVTGKNGNPLLVIAGSDRRGTAYGATTVSRLLGVDPWVWWADVPVARNPEVSLKADYISEAPSVKYRECLSTMKTGECSRGRQARSTVI